MKALAVLSFSILLAGCASFPEFTQSPEKYTGYRVGQEFEVRRDLIILKYDYLIIPLVNPGVQLCEPDSDLPQEFKIVGRLAQGDRLKIKHFKIDGGWIPCQDDKFLANPVADILTGASKGKTVGVSLISTNEGHKAMEFKTGKMIYLAPNPAILRPVR